MLKEMKKKTIIIIIVAVILLLAAALFFRFFLFPAPQIPAGQGIDEATATQLVFEQSGLTQDQVSMLRTTLEMDDGRWEYEVKFFIGSQEYSYQVDAATGTITDAESESIFD